jgi:ribosomal protein S12 methylthiotransferase accessory factor
VAARLGITRVANVTGLDYVGSPVFTAVRPNARSLAISLGKGVTKAAAYASALMEAVEVAHAEDARLPIQWASRHEMYGSAVVIDTTKLPLHLNHEPYSDDVRMAWTEGYDLLQKCSSWVPDHSVTLDFVGSQQRLFVRSSNGLASGNTLAEAAVHGLCELLERDARALWLADPHSGEQPERRLDLQGVDDVHCRQVLDRIDRARLMTAAYDITTDSGVPAFSAIVSERPGAMRPIGPQWGHGCHPDPAVALSRALTESLQARLGHINGARDDVTPEYYAASTSQESLRDLEEILLASESRGRLSERPSLSTDTIEGDLEALLDRCLAIGVESVVVVDLTREDIGVPVVKMIATTLESIPAVAVPGPRARRLGEG